MHLGHNPTEEECVSQQTPLPPMTTQAKVHILANIRWGLPCFCLKHDRLLRSKKGGRNESQKLIIVSLQPIDFCHCDPCTCPIWPSATDPLLPMALSRFTQETQRKLLLERELTWNESLPRARVPNHLFSCPWPEPTYSLPISSSPA